MERRLQSAFWTAGFSWQLLKRLTLLPINSKMLSLCSSIRSSIRKKRECATPTDSGQKPQESISNKI